jgi:hypothetical protein
VIESTKEGYESDVPEDLEEDADEGKSRRWVNFFLLLWRKKL